MLIDLNVPLSLNVNLSCCEMSDTGTVTTWVPKIGGYGSWIGSSSGR